MANGLPAHLRKKMKSENGLTLMEVIVVIAIMAVIAGVAVPILFRGMGSFEIKSTQEEMENILQVFMGNPDKGSYGFLGDLGILPDELEWLVKNPGFPVYQPQTNGVGVGWNGPYLSPGFDPEGFKKDAWGNDYGFKFDYSQKLSKGIVVLTSMGPNGGWGGGDNIELRREFHTHRDIYIKVYAWKGGAWVVPDKFKGELFYSGKGQEQKLSFDQDKAVIKYIHRGLHAVHAVSSNPDQEAWKNFYVGEGTITVDIYLQ